MPAEEVVLVKFRRSSVVLSRETEKAALFGTVLLWCSEFEEVAVESPKFSVCLECPGVFFEYTQCATVTLC